MFCDLIQYSTRLIELIHSDGSKPTQRYFNQKVPPSRTHPQIPGLGFDVSASCSEGDLEWAEGPKVLGRGVWESDKGVLRLSKMNDAPDLLLGYPPNKRKEQQ